MTWVAADMARLDLLDLVLRAAVCGDPEPLARHIESGGPITPDMRVLIADRLRGKKQRTGRPRTYKKRVREMPVMSAIRTIQSIEECSESTAISKLDVTVNPDTVGSTMKRIRKRGGVWKP